MLEINHLSKTYADNEAAAVCDISLAVKAETLLTLVGESGCGKTTLLRLIAGLENPNQGNLLLDGQQVVGGGAWVPPEHRNIGMVFQGGALFPHLTVEKNIAYGLAHLPRKEQYAVINDHLALIDLAHARKRYPHELSGGERQRVALIRALAPNPKLLLLDEPFSNLNIALKSKLRQEIRAILLAKKMTAILVTHDPLDAHGFGDEIVIMRGGKIEQQGAVKRVKQCPINQYCAELI